MRALKSIVLCLFVAAATTVFAENVTFSTRVIVSSTREHDSPNLSKDVVVWLTPIGASTPATVASHPYRLIQHNKSFMPHVLVVPVGAMVEFPNHDPYFHNVFSLFEGKRFDLGLYESGSTREVKFDKPGISYIFCNIHAQMSAVVVSLATPYYAISDAQGDIVIPNVPIGRYEMKVWYERAPEPLQAAGREITISREDSSLAPLRLQAVDAPAAHKNLYGHDYDPPEPASPVYSRP